MPILRHAFRPVVWPALMLTLIVWLQPWLEVSMGRHMVLELPLLFGCGWLFAAALRPYRHPATDAGAGNHRRRMQPLAALPALLAALLISSFWMLPIALDNAVLSPRHNLLKFLSVLLAGCLTGLAWRRTSVILQGFFIVNWAWMTITAGMLYQTAPQQLCSVYLDEQQKSAGTGLVLLASLLLGTWLLLAMLKLTREETAGQDAGTGQDGHAPSSHRHDDDQRRDEPKNSRQF